MAKITRVKNEIQEYNWCDYCLNIRRKKNPFYRHQSSSKDHMKIAESIFLLPAYAAPKQSNINYHNTCLEPRTAVHFTTEGL